MWLETGFTRCTYLSFPRAALANKNFYIAQNQRQGSKPGTRQSVIFIFLFSFLFFVFFSFHLLFLFQSGYSTTTGAAMMIRKELLVIGAFSTSIIAKQNVLHSVSGHLKVQAPNWTPFCYCVITIIA